MNSTYTAIFVVTFFKIHNVAERGALKNIIMKTIKGQGGSELRHKSRKEWVSLRAA